MAECVSRGLQLSCFLVTAWEAFAKWEKKSIWERPVEFLDVSVFQPVKCERTDKVKLGVIFDFSNRFQARLRSFSSSLLPITWLASFNSPRVQKP